MKIPHTGWLLTGLAVMVMTGCPDGDGGNATTGPTGNAPSTTVVPSAVDDDDAVPTVGNQDISPDLDTAGRAAPPQKLPLIRMGDGRFGELLEVVVDRAGLVRYDLLTHPRWSATLDTVVDAYAKADLPANRDARLAFWCNAYNANVLAMVMEHRDGGGLGSVRDVSGFFDEKTIKVAGEPLTLNQLENDRIRPLGDPRIHAALVCAAVSCPPLRDEPFSPATLDGQLGDQSARWVNDASRNTVEGGTLKVSAIFDWYRADFDAEPYGGIVTFIQAWAEDGSPLKSIAADAEVEFLEYDWSLNQAPTRDVPEK